MISDLLLYVFIGIIVFMALREFMTWYWKQNRIVELLDKIEQNTRTQKSLDPNIQGQESRNEKLL